MNKSYYLRTVYLCFQTNILTEYNNFKTNQTDCFILTKCGENKRHQFLFSKVSFWHKLWNVLYNFSSRKTQVGCLPFSQNVRKFRLGISVLKDCFPFEMFWRTGPLNSGQSAKFGMIGWCTRPEDLELVQKTLTGKMKQAAAILNNYTLT